MDKHEIRQRARVLYEDELQYAIARDDEVDVTRCRARAAVRLGRELDGQDISGIWLGYVEGIAKTIEVAFEDDLSDGHLRFGGTIRTAANRLVPSGKARRQDLIAHDLMREQKFVEHAAKRTAERSAIAGLVARLDEFGGDPTLFEACPDLFEETQAA